LLSLPAVLFAYQPVEVSVGGSISGMVKFSGESSPRSMYATYGDKNCPAGVPQEQIFVKQENRGIKNVLITLEISQGKPLRRINAQLAMQGCKFVPHIQWLPKDTSLRLVNEDAAVHNAHALRGVATAFNADVPANSRTFRRPLVDTGLYKI